ncbi:MAG: 23S rRNA pseudouridylate synthase, partial [Buchnera aphidicola]|nr:23S rRNA pseudouridylate synthase [Buchnera aphidicola]
MHPKYAIEREYYIRVFGSVNIDIMNRLNHAIKIHNTIFKLKKIIALNNTLKKNIWFKAILCEGKNREIRKIFNFFNCQVNRLIRVRYGNVILPKSLKTGHFIELNSILVHNLYKLISKS